MRDKALERSGDGVDIARRFGTETFDRTKSKTGELSGRIADRARRIRADGEQGDDTDA